MKNPTVLPHFNSNALKLGSARLHARIARRLSGETKLKLETGRLNSAHDTADSLWSPLRLDLLKAPLTRRRE
jgi:hypothetical protein